MLKRYPFIPSRWFATALIFVLIITGLIFIYSTTTTTTTLYSVFFKKQLFGVLIGLGVYFLFSYLDYRSLLHFGYFFYFFIITLLIFTLVKGKIGMGAQRWIDFKLFRIQPSELAKLFLPASIVYRLHTEHAHTSYKTDHFYFIFFILIWSVILILKQPDLGTAVLIGLSGIILCWLAGLSSKIIRICFLIAALISPLAWPFLKSYQQQRIISFIGYGTSEKERYHIEQSKIAIGSGGFWGKGFGKGTQNKFQFLPERRTDFIFAVICEEWGFLGAFFFLLIYFLLLAHYTLSLYHIPYFFARLLCSGLLLPIVLSAIINIFMVCGLIPVVGIPLPLISYGLSSLWVTLAAFGWIQGIIHQSSKTNR